MEAIDVLIVGAGPVGLTLAVELETAGVHAVVLDRLAVPDAVPKARGVGVLGSEALRRRGMGAALQRWDSALRREFRREMGSDRGQFAWIHKLDTTVLGGGDGRTGALIWQPDLELVLAEAALGLGCDVRRGQRVTQIRQDGGRVHVAVETDAGEVRYAASYVVGCDGGRSVVRKSAGFEFPGVDATTLTRVARVRPVDPEAFPARIRTARGTLQYREFRDGWVRVRVSEPDPDGIGARETAPVTVGEFQDSLERVTGVDVRLDEIAEARRMRVTSRQAATYRLGRILLAGDAAHVHSPAGGQGLNLGIMDAVNLGWKLAAVVAGDGDDELLNSYTRERHPVGARVIANTLAQAALLEPTPEVNALREIFSDLMDIPDVQAHLGRLLSGVDERYPLPYVGEHRSLGMHLPDFVVDDTTLYMLMSGGRPLLLYTPFAAEAAAAAADWDDRVHVVPVHLLGRLDLSAALIRPDGVLAWAAGVSDEPALDSLTDALSTWFGPSRSAVAR
ncbi:FAD-dependent monooxygenase [Tsukamurella soli]|uniref:FAD-dependent monooxygenase n=1 Tax=Tsukamurella soli TaxID=644556 RepID=A0ABP8JUS0_9ACTN